MARLYVWACSCGAEQAMTEEANRVLRQSSATFYCVHGHARHYPQGPSEEDNLRRERDRLKQNEAYLNDRLQKAKESAEHERRRANGYKGFAAKITKRAKSGVCPCCNRHFTALERHMSSKHPKFTVLEPTP